jgi:AraC-like DNA-binding protein
MRAIQRIQFLILVILAVIGNQLLLRKYGSRAEQFYSDITDGKFINAKMLNYSFLVLLGASFVAVAAGRRMLMPKDTILYAVWAITSVVLYFIGYMGFRQKTINPTFEPVNPVEKDQNDLDSISNGIRKTIITKMLFLFEVNKIHLDSELNIMDIVAEVGSNRSYISSIINQKYNQNFCSFVNEYRIEELERILFDHPDLTNEMLAEHCGFGSVISLRRAIVAKTGMSVTEWKEKQARSRN